MRRISTSAKLRSFYSSEWGHLNDDRRQEVQVLDPPREFFKRKRPAQLRAILQIDRMGCHYG